MAEVYYLNLTTAQRHFVLGVLEAALFTSSDTDGTPLDTLGYDTGDLTDESHKTIVDMALAFLREIDSQGLTDEWDTVTNGEGYSIYHQAGNDLVFTAAGHGVGYWDRPEIYGQAKADHLTKMCELNPYRRIEDWNLDPIKDDDGVTRLYL